MIHSVFACVRVCVESVLIHDTSACVWHLKLFQFRQACMCVIFSIFLTWCRRDYNGFTNISVIGDCLLSLENIELSPSFSYFSLAKMAAHM